MTKASDLLDGAMEQRRIELGMSWKEVAEAASVSVETLTALRKGRTNARNANPLTKRGIERGLRWAAGSFDDALEGRNPKPLTGRPDREHTPPRQPSEIDPWSLSEEEFRRMSAEDQMAVMARMYQVAQESREHPGSTQGPERPAM